MGIKGTVRRSTDGDFIHANVDIDLIISEEPEYGSLEKPVEIFHIIEHFCLGRRRYLFDEIKIYNSNGNMCTHILLMCLKIDLYNFYYLTLILACVLM